jgi:hypothetical protein
LFSDLVWRVTLLGSVLGTFLATLAISIPAHAISVGSARLTVPLILARVAAAVLAHAGVAVLSLVLLAGLAALTRLPLSRLSLTGLLSLSSVILVLVVVLSAVSHLKLLRLVKVPALR